MPWTTDWARPQVNDRRESNLPGLYIIGDLAGAPVVKLAMEQGFELAERIAAFPDARGPDPAVFDVVVIGAGAAGLNCALTLHDRGLRVVVLEKAKLANTIEDFPEGKWIYAEPESRPAKGKLWLEEATKEDLLDRWRRDVEDTRLDIRTGQGVTSLERPKAGGFIVKTSGGEYPARRVVLATGQRANPRKLGVPGEDQPFVCHRLYNPHHYHDENILVVGGGNSAVEAALTLCVQNRVVLSYRGGELFRPFAENRKQLAEAVGEGRIRLLLNSQAMEFGDHSARLHVDGREEEVPCRHAFVLIGAEPPVAFLKSLGIRLENEWSGNWGISLALLAAAFGGMWVYQGQNPVGLAVTLAALAGLIAHGWRGCRYSWLALSFFLCYSLYGVKRGVGREFWPYTNWAASMASFFGRPLGFWYTVIYTLLLTGFGFQAMSRWGFKKKDRFQIWRYATLIGFQWTFFFLIPEFLLQWAVKNAWIGERLSHDPKFAGELWRSYGLVYAWPLFFHTFLGSPHRFWIYWGVFMAFVLIPVLVLFHGKRYCSWICGCGGLAETLGDRWRHLAPKGRASIRWERMGDVVLVAAVVITAMTLLRDVVTAFRAASVTALNAYGLYVDLWLVGLIPVTLYPFLGGKIWCRYWCPLAKIMQWQSALFTRWKVSRFAIHSNDKCIACGECTRYCQVGIDVMQFALKQAPIDNLSTSCIGCGICVTACPMGVLSFQNPVLAASLVQIGPAGTAA